MLIGQVADATGVTAKTLRFYEAEGLLDEPDRTAGGYRDYSPEVVDRVGFIRQAQAAGLTLSQISEILDVRDGGRAPCGHVAGLVDERLADIDRRLSELRRTRTQLQQLRTRLDQLDPADCPPGKICAAVSPPSPP